MAYETWACKYRLYLPGLTLYIYASTHYFDDYRSINLQRLMQVCTDSPGPLLLTHKVRVKMKTTAKYFTSCPA